MLKYLKMMRMKHYLKNALIFVPLAFSGYLFDKARLSSTLIGVIAFCLIASVVYIFNDIMDVEKDRKHPVKRMRPIACGEISIKNAVICGILLFVISMIITLFSVTNSIIYLLIYLILNFAYSAGLKDQPIVDIALLVSGFLIRVLYGGLVAGVEVSGWLYLTAISISFFLVFGKRRNELVKYGKEETRKVLKHYTKDFLNRNMYMCLALTICFYALWTMNHVSNLMLWSVPIVMLITMKYSLDVEGTSDGDPVEVLLHDKALMLMCLGYIVFVLLILYGGK